MIPRSVAIRGERGSYNRLRDAAATSRSVAIRGERGSYNTSAPGGGILLECSYPG